MSAKPLLTLLVAACAAIGAGYFLGNSKPSVAEAPAVVAAAQPVRLVATAESAAPVTVPVEAEVTPKASVVENDGIRVLVVPEKEATLVAQLAGNLVEVNGRLGAAFKKGEELVRYDCSEQRARKGIAEADLDGVRHTYDAKLRMQGLNQAGELEVALAATEVNKAKAQLTLVEAELAHCRVTAPFNGRVAKTEVKAFEGVSVGQPLLEIVSDEDLKLKLNVPAAWVRWIEIGTPFTVAIEELDIAFDASVTALNSRIDAVSLSLEIEGKPSAPVPQLLPGMSGLAQFEQAQETP